MRTATEIAVLILLPSRENPKHLPVNRDHIQIVAEEFTGGLRLPGQVDAVVHLEDVADGGQPPLDAFAPVVVPVCLCLLVDHEEVSAQSQEVIHLGLVEECPPKVLAESNREHLCSPLS